MLKSTITVVNAGGEAEDIIGKGFHVYCAGNATTTFDIDSSLAAAAVLKINSESNLLSASAGAATDDGVNPDPLSNIPYFEKGEAGGVASLDSDGHVIEPLAVDSEEENLLKRELKAGESYSGTVAALIAKNYMEDDSVVVDSDEFAGLAVFLKQLAALAGGAKSALLSLHQHSGSSVVIDFGLRLFGNLDVGIQLTGGESAIGMDLSNQTITEADFKNSAGKRTAYNTAAPDSGAWVQGDIVFNTAPTAGGNIGWVCTEAGEPGTWKTFGVIEGAE